jgi:hypothetical protein
MYGCGGIRPIFIDTESWPPAKHPTPPRLFWPQHATASWHAGGVPDRRSEHGSTTAYPIALQLTLAAVDPVISIDDLRIGWIDDRWQKIGLWRG